MTESGIVVAIPPLSTVRYGDRGFTPVILNGEPGTGKSEILNRLSSVLELPKPVVMVLGNHDYWSGRMHGLFGASNDAGNLDMADRLAEFKQLAAGSNVHVLERESVILKAGGKRVRFLGATLWTSYGDGNPALMEIGSKTMNDTVMIGVEGWIHASKKNAKSYKSWRQARGYHDSEKACFDAPVALDIHTKTVAWLERQLKRPGTWDHTVVVTHHWPSWDILVAKKVIRQPEVALDPDYWEESKYRPDRDELGVCRLAAYGSPMEAFMKRYREQIDAWFCGHVHTPVDVGLNGVRLVANPRGYPYNDGENKGNAGSDFDERKVINLADGVMRALLPEIATAAKVTDALIDELKLLAKYVYDEADLYQREIMRAAFDSRCKEITRIATKISDDINSNLAAQINLGLRKIISPPEIQACGRDPFESVRGDDFPASINDPAEQSIHSATRFLRRLRLVHRKPEQFHRVQEYLVSKAVRRLAAHGIRARVTTTGGRFIDGNVFIYVDEAGRTHEELLAIIDRRASGSLPYMQGRLHLVCG